MKENRLGLRLMVARKTGAGVGKERYGLPDDLLEYSLRRLTFLAIIVGIIWITSIVSNVVHDYVRTNSDPMPPVTVWIRVVGIVISIAVITIIRYTRLPLQLKCDLGLVYEVLGAAVVFAFELTMRPAFGLPIGVISFVSIWILVFRMIVPNSSIRTGVTVTLTASTLPVLVWLFEGAGYPPLPPLEASVLYKSTFFTALIAWFASRSIYHFGAAVSKERIMGSYRLERQLGKGGMGEVWLASHSLLKRPAAIKLILSEKLGAAGIKNPQTKLRRFELEAQATAKLNSPHTVQLYDFGTTDDGSLFYVMELLEGLDLDAMVERYGPVEPERAVFLLKQICHSLMDAHESGMIHRDIKPANIRLCHLGPDYDFVKVLDFGLVKHIDTLDETNSDLTMEGIATGTPAYMAPEIALGKRDIGATTDIYMLGCVGYWLLSGRLLFDGETPMEVVSHHIQTDPVRVSERTELEIPKALDQLIMDCLKKDREKRPQSARELYDRLEACSTGTPWTQERARHWWQTHQPDK